MQQPWDGAWTIVGGEESSKYCSLLFGLHEPCNIVGRVGGKELGGEDEVSLDSGFSSNDGIRIASAAGVEPNVGVGGAGHAEPLAQPPARFAKAAPKSLLWPRAARPKAARNHP